MRIKNNVMIAALAAAALGLSACGGDAGEPTPEPAPTTVAAATEEATSAVEETTP